MVPNTLCSNPTQRTGQIDSNLVVSVVQMRSGGRIRGAEDTDGARGPAGWGRSWTSEPGCCRGGCKQSAGLGELWNARLAIGLVCVAAIHHVGEREGERGSQ